MENKYPDQMLGREEVQEMTRLSRSVLYREMAAGSFPKGRKTSEGGTSWIVSEVLDWMKKTPKRDYPRKAA